ncbi:hypothetical protein ACWKWU_19250 [Chitinophaga lutea]
MLRYISFVLLCCGAGAACAQSHPFSVGHTVGIPGEKHIRFFETLYDEKQEKNVWTFQSEMAIPAGAIDFCGNERKLLVLFKDSIVVYDNEWDRTIWARRGAFPFPAGVSVTPRQIIRGEYSSEAGFSYLDGQLETAHAKDGDEWLDVNSFMYKTIKPHAPELPCGDYDYLFEYGNNHFGIAMIKKDAVEFCVPSRYILLKVKQMMPAGEVDKMVKDLQARRFPLPAGAKSAFVYLWNYIGVETEEGIDFYAWSKPSGKWEKDEGKRFVMSDVATTAGVPQNR